MKARLFSHASETECPMTHVGVVLADEEAKTSAKLPTTKTSGWKPD